MAQQGLFGNQYQQAIVDEQNLRRQSAQTGGLTGWAAITNAMSGIGSELGYQGGQMLGGQTPAQVQQANFQSVINSVPDFDPMNPESLQKMSSAMWKGGFYDEGMNLLNTSQSMLKDNALIDLYSAQAEDERRVTAGPDNRTTNKKTYDDLVVEGTVTSTYNDWLDKQDLTNDEKEYERVSNEGTFTGTFEEWKDRNVKEDVVEEKEWKFSNVPSQLRADIETQVKKVWDYGVETIGGIDTDYKWKDMVTQVYFISKNLGITPYDLLNNPITVDGTERRVTDTDIMKNWRTVFNVSSSIAGTSDPEGGFENQLQNN